MTLIGQNLQPLTSLNWIILFPLTSSAPKSFSNQENKQNAGQKKDKNAFNEVGKGLWVAEKVFQ